MSDELAAWLLEQSTPPPLDDTAVSLPAYCHCGDRECWHWSPSYYGYLFCRPCREHHRPPECCVDASGRALRSDGTPWEEDARP